MPRIEVEEGCHEIQAESREDCQKNDPGTARREEDIEGFLWCVAGEVYANTIGER